MIRSLTVLDEATLHDPAEVQIVVSGDVDLATSWDLVEQVITALPPTPTAVVIDASRVTFIDVYGINCLLILRARLRAQRHDLILTAPSPAVLDTLSHLHLVDQLGPGMPPDGA